MSDPTAPNPYQSPQSSAEGQAYATSGVAESLGKTRPWVLMLAIVGCIGLGFMLLGMVGMLAGAAMSAPGMPAGFGAIMAAFYGVMIVGYLFPIVFMFKYAGRIRQFTVSTSPADLESALSAQKSIWKSIGIAMIAGILLYIVFMVWLVTNAQAINSGPNFGSTGQPVPTAPAGESDFDELFD